MIVKRKEVDFILQKGDEIKYVQVADQFQDKKTIEREFGNLLAIPDNHEKTVISMHDVPIKNKEGIKHESIWNT
jgi:hypothetical protein